MSPRPRVPTPADSASLAPALARGDRITARLREDPRAGAREAESFVREARRDGSRAVLAVALWTRGHARRIGRRIDQALADYREARALFQRCRLPVLAARTAIGMVEVLSMAGRFAEASALARGARERFRQAGESLRAAQLEANLGNLSERTGRHHAALARYRAAARAFAELGNETSLGRARYNQANVLLAIDRPDEAIPLLRASAAHWATTGADAALAQCRLALGEALFRTGRPRDALEELEDATAVAQRLRDPLLGASAALQRARIEALLNRPDRVAVTLDPWLPEFEKLHLRMDEIEARVRHALAILVQGRIEEALAELEAAERRCTELRQPSRRAWVRYHRALADRACGRLLACRTALGQCIRDFARSGLRDLEAEARLVRAAIEPDPGSLRVARELEATRRTVHQSINPWLVEHWTRRNALHRSARGSTRDVLKGFERAHQILERLRRSLPENALRAFLLADKSELYDAAVALPTNRPDLFAARAGARWAWSWTERAHAPLLRDARIDAAPVGNRPWADRIARERARLARLDLEELALMPAGRARIRSAPTLARRLSLQRLERFQRRFELARAREHRPLAAPPSVDRIQRALAPGELLIEYHAGQRGIWLIRASRESVECVPVDAKPDDLRAATHRLRKLWERRRLMPSQDDARATLRSAETSLMAELSEQLLRPALAGTRFDRLAIVPHRWLHGIPFHALPFGTACLIDAAPVRYGYTAAHALLTRTSTSRGTTLLVGCSSPEAPEAEAEALALRSLWPDPIVLTGTAATPAEIRRQWGNASVIHIAAHGERHPDDPWSSGLILHQGRFAVYDCDAIHTRAEVVVLSACRTADAVVWGSDDALGLLPALARSGARTVVASLWTVSDAVTHRWVLAFHAHLARGARVDEAVRSASLAVRATVSTPFEWAPFAPYGAAGAGVLTP